MREITFGVSVAVLEEVFGRGLFWLMIMTAVLVAAAYLYVLFRDRAMGWRKFRLSQFSMPIGAVVAVAFLLSVTHSTFGDIGGAIDIMVFLGAAVVGAVGIAILVYTGQSLIRSQRFRLVPSPA